MAERPGAAAIHNQPTCTLILIINDEVDEDKVDKDKVDEDKVDKDKVDEDKVKTFRYSENLQVPYMPYITSPLVL